MEVAAQLLLFPGGLPQAGHPGFGAFFGPAGLRRFGRGAALGDGPRFNRLPGAGVA